MMAGPLPTSPLGSMEMGGKDMLQRWRQSLPSMPLPPTIQVDTTMIIIFIKITISRNLPPPQCLRASPPKSVETARRRGRLLLLLPRYDHHHHSFDDDDDDHDHDHDHDDYYYY